MSRKKDQKKLDRVDLQILWLLSEDPEMCQEEMARYIGISQPAVCIRLKKLRKMGILTRDCGIDAKKLNLVVAIASGKPSKNIETLLKIPYVVALFKTEKDRYVAFLVGENRETVMSVAKKCFLDGEVDIVEDFVECFPVKLKKPIKIEVNCRKCKFYESGCLGMPGTPWYRGSLWKGIL